MKFVRLLCAVPLLLSISVTHARAETSSAPSKQNLIEVFQILSEWETRHPLNPVTAQKFKLISEAFAGTGDPCLLPGYTGTEGEDGSCKASESDRPDFEACGQEKYPCNKDVFGTDADGKIRCMDRKESTGRWTMVCAGTVLGEALNESLADAIKKLRTKTLDPEQSSKFDQFLTSRGANLDQMKNFVSTLCNSSSNLSLHDFKDCKKMSRLLGTEMKGAACAVNDPAHEQAKKLRSAMAKAGAPQTMVDCYRISTSRFYDSKKAQKVFDRLNYSLKFGALKDLGFPEGKTILNLGYRDPVSYIYLDAPNALMNPGPDQKSLKLKLLEYQTMLSRKFRTKIIQLYAKNKAAHYKVPNDEEIEREVSPEKILFTLEKLALAVEQNKTGGDHKGIKNSEAIFSLGKNKYYKEIDELDVTTLNFLSDLKSLAEANPPNMTKCDTNASQKLFNPPPRK